MISRRTLVTSALGVSAVATLAACAEQTPLSSPGSISSSPSATAPSAAATPSPSASEVAEASPSPSPSKSTKPNQATQSPQPSKSAKPTSSPEPSESPEEKVEGIEVCKTSDIPVGSGRKFTVSGLAILITQPRSGTFRGFSASCTHAGYVMENVANSEIKCDSHGSVFSADNGSVIQGPAQRALGKIEVKVSSDRVFVIV